MELHRIMTETGSQQDLDVCCLCFVSESARPKQTFNKFEDVSHMITDLYGLVQDESFSGQKLCEGCLNELYAAVSFRNRIRLTQVVWQKYRNPVDNPEWPDILDEDVEVYCHVCDVQWKFGKLSGHIGTVHGSETDHHLSNCGLCECILGPTYIEIDTKADCESEDDVAAPDEDQSAEETTCVVETRRRGKKRYVCEVIACTKTFTKKDKLQAHFDESHRPVIPFVRPKRTRRLSKGSTELLNTSDDTKDNARPFACHICEASYSRKDKLKRHLLKSHETLEVPEINSEPLFSCPNCENKYRNQTTFDKHLLEHDPTPFNCAICDEAFAIRGDRRQHELICLRLTSTGDGQQCPSCLEVFPTPAELRVHRLATHGEMQQEHVCKECKKSFEKLQQLLIHMDEVHERNIPCSSCDKTFPNRSMLKRHFDKYHNRRHSLVCTKCGQRLSRADKLVEHMYMHEGFPCSKCNILMPTRKEWERHRKEHSSE